VRAGARCGFRYTALKLVPGIVTTMSPPRTSTWRSVSRRASILAMARTAISAQRTRRLFPSLAASYSRFAAPPAATLSATAKEIAACSASSRSQKCLTDFPRSVNRSAKLPQAKFRHMRLKPSGKQKGPARGQPLQSAGRCNNTYNLPLRFSHSYRKQLNSCVEDGAMTPNVIKKTDGSGVPSDVRIARPSRLGCALFFGAVTCSEQRLPGNCPLVVYWGLVG
jgi:hypothetical protein